MFLLFSINLSTLLWETFCICCRQFCLLLKEDCWCHGLSREWKRNLSPSFDDNNEKQISRRFNLEYDAQRRSNFLISFFYVLHLTTHDVNKTTSWSSFSWPIKTETGQTRRDNNETFVRKDWRRGKWEEVTSLTKY